MKTLVIGGGEVGKSLFNVLSKHYPSWIRDVESDFVEHVDAMNICFPYSDKFTDIVREYQGLYNPLITIIHSTVPVGTSRELGAVHSPIHGKHPDLTKSILTFTKYVGGVQAKEAAEYLEGAGIKTKIVSSSEASELSKIMCTTQYGWNIVIMKEIERLCTQYGVPFSEVYGWNKFYNEGYKELGMKQFTRPELTYALGKIGGHCVVQNCHLVDSPVTKFIIEQNEKY